MFAVESLILSLHISLNRLLVILVLSALGISCVHARNSLTSQKSATIKKLIEATDVQRFVAENFEEFVTRYQKNWPEGVIADYRANGLFKPLSPEKTAEMEKLVHEFSDHLFSRIKKRVVNEVITQENVEAVSASVYDKYLTEDEINRLLAFSQSPTGKKLIDRILKLRSEAVLADLQARGAFDVSSPEAEKAKGEQLNRELERNPVHVYQQVLAREKVLSQDYLSGDEIRELTAVSQTPLGKKLTEKSPQMMAEIAVNASKVLGPRFEEVFREEFGEQMKFFQQRTREIMKDTTVRGSTKRPPGN